MDFIRIWENGNLEDDFLEPYNDHKNYCTIGVGHLIDGQVSQLQNDFSELADIRRARFFIAF
ncbi:hypothetical protein IV454_27815 [Massilia antarctica]|uniref:Lysozyme n=1 Tax=Massilia antarctica TaxID=2765360 RepID=A0AA48WC50_9BURK|nr:hypothetical protein IV454_27815 [Massilia antarctica]